MSHISELDKSESTDSENSKTLTRAGPIATTASTNMIHSETDEQNSEQNQIANSLVQTANGVEGRVTASDGGPVRLSTTTSQKEHGEMTACIIQPLHHTTVSALRDESANGNLQDGRFMEGTTSAHLPLNNPIHYDPTSNPSTHCFEHDSDMYDFSHQKRGYALIIVNEEFNGKRNRPGAMDDLIKMRFIVRKLGFELLNKTSECNLTKQETLQLLTKAHQLNHSKCDSFMLMISTHGFETQNTRANVRLDHALVCADEDYIFTRDILEMFNDERCPSLREKPKLFFIQACRGKGFDHGCDICVDHSSNEHDITLMKHNTTDSCKTDLPNVQGQATVAGNPPVHTYKISQPHDSNDAYVMPDEPAQEEDALRDVDVCNSSTQTDAVLYASSRAITQLYTTHTPRQTVTDQSPDTPVLECHPDMLVMYAIPDGMIAWRSSAGGSWMIDDLYKVIGEYDLERPQPFLKVLTKVSAYMSLRKTFTPKTEETHMLKAVPVIEHRLLKDIIFGQKY